jgi:hypothetical protein
MYQTGGFALSPYVPRGHTASLGVQPTMPERSSLGRTRGSIRPRAFVFSAFVGRGEVVSACRPNAPFAQLVRLSQTSIADEMREEHRRRVLGG